MSARDVAGYLLAGLVLLSGGCAGTQRDDTLPLRLSEELGRARALAEWERAHAAQAEARAALLESRVARLESDAREAEKARRLETSHILSRLDRALEGTASATVSSNVSSAPKSDAVSGELRLSADEERALRVLLRAERKLDTANPWQSALY